MHNILFCITFFYFSKKMKLTCIFKILDIYLPNKKYNIFRDKRDKI